jgi:hypothetical protein
MHELKRLAIDPGDKHVGWAYSPDGATVTSGEWRPGEAVDRVVRMMTLDEVQELIVEEFILYEWEAKKQAWSKLQTSQLIGGLKVVAHFFRIPVVEQGAYIKKPTRAQLAGRKIAMQGGSIHSKDAQLHLWYRILRSRGESES